MKTSRVLIALVGAAAALAASPALAATCAPKGSEAAVVETARDLFAAAKTDDEARFRALITPDFYAYDGGKRLDGMALFELIKTAHAAGKRYEWSVDQPDVRLACDWAFLAYVNHGWVEDDKGRTTLTWLESDVLHYQAGHWRITFLHSTRAAPAP
jgi:hypothetical protein